MSLWQRPSIFLSATTPFHHSPTNLANDANSSVHCPDPNGPANKNLSNYCTTSPGHSCASKPIPKMSWGAQKTNRIQSNPLEECNWNKILHQRKPPVKQSTWNELVKGKRKGGRVSLSPENGKMDQWKRANLNISPNHREYIMAFVWEPHQAIYQALMRGSLPILLENVRGLTPRGHASPRRLKPPHSGTIHKLNRPTAHQSQLQRQKPAGCPLKPPLLLRLLQATALLLL